MYTSIKQNSRTHISHKSRQLNNFQFNEKTPLHIPCNLAHHCNAKIKYTGFHGDAKSFPRFRWKAYLLHFIRMSKSTIFSTPRHTQKKEYKHRGTLSRVLQTSLKSIGKQPREPSTIPMNRHLPMQIRAQTPRDWQAANKQTHPVTKAWLLQPEYKEANAENPKEHPAHTLWHENTKLQINRSRQTEHSQGRISD